MRQLVLSCFSGSLFDDDRSGCPGGPHSRLCRPMRMQRCGGEGFTQQIQLRRHNAEFTDFRESCLPGEPKRAFTELPSPLSDHPAVVCRGLTDDLPGGDADAGRHLGVVIMGEETPVRSVAVEKGLNALACCRNIDDGRRHCG